MKIQLDTFDVLDGLGKFLGALAILTASAMCVALCLTFLAGSVKVVLYVWGMML